MPVGPLVAAVAARGGFATLVAAASASAGPRARQEAKRLRRAWDRARSKGRMTPAAADLLAVHLLGVTPGQVWGDEWTRLDARAPRRRRSGSRATDAAAA